MPTVEGLGLWLEEEQGPQWTGASHSLMVTGGAEQERVPEKPSTFACLSSVPYVGWVCGTSPPASVGQEIMVRAGFERVQKGNVLASSTGQPPQATEHDSCARGLQEGRGSKATSGQPSPSCFSLPPCSRDLKRDVAKKLEKLKKRTQRAIAELIRKCSTWEGGVLPTGWWPKHRNPSHSFCLPSIPGERLKGQDDSLASAVDAATEQKACDSD